MFPEAPIYQSVNIDDVASHIQVFLTFLLGRRHPPSQMVGLGVFLVSWRSRHLAFFPSVSLAVIEPGF